MTVDAAPTNVRLFPRTIAALWGSVPVATLAHQYRCSPETMRAYARKLGLPDGRTVYGRRAIPADELPLLAELRGRGISLRKLARVWRVDKDTVARATRPHARFTERKPPGT